uniref:ThiJ/PfpI domain protein n=1 Tax=Caulobacter sp. (strain K31) TaxID=366602 RepID=B0SXI7_CAUSK
MRKPGLSIALAALLASASSAMPAAPASGAPLATQADTVGTAIMLPAPKAGRMRPLVAVVADGAGAETTDFLIPYGVLKEAGVADVIGLSTADAPLQLMMTVKIQPDQTTARFDAAQPAGADIVIVPAQHHPKSPALIAWIRKQAAQGAVIVSICEGARVVAAAGLLDGKRATTHFAALEQLEKAYPKTTWVRDRRWVQDGRIISTTGVSASVPTAIALVEAIAGRQAAEATAARLGAGDWSPRHRTAEFKIERSDYAVGMANLAAAWKHETVEAPLKEGVDEIALALQTDAWRRGMRAKVVVTGVSPVRSRHGLTILPDALHRADAIVLAPPAGGSTAVLDWTLAEMTRRYGPETARLAWLGMEYGREDGARH